MKAKIGLAILFSLFFLLFSCEKPQTFDSTMMIGKWQQGTVFEVYQSDGNGHTWDTADDVTEDEAQKFRWTLNGDQLIGLYDLYKKCI